MGCRAVGLGAVVVVSACVALAADTPPKPAVLPAAEIVARNVAARGGAQTWRAVNAIVMTGKMEAGGNSRTTLPMPGRKDERFMPPPRPAEQAKLPFVMTLQRPRKSRVDIVFNGQTATQIFDGTNGWKLRPFLNRREVEPYTEEELRMAAMQAELDGPLMSYAAKGTTVETAGTEVVEGRQTYKLKLTRKDGTTTNVWIDAETFLEAKVEGTPRRLDGRSHPVEVFYRDYRPVSGLKIPFALETRVVNPSAVGGPAPMRTASEQIVLDRVEVNPKLSETLFTKADLDAAASGKPLATASAATRAR